MNVFCLIEGSDTTEVKILVVFDVLRDFKQLLSAEAMFDKDRRDKMKFFDFNKYLEQKVLCNYEYVHYNYSFSKF